MTDANVNLTETGYDGAGRTVVMVDGEENVRVTAYDQAGRKMLDVAPDLGVTQYDHDAAGNLKALTDMGGTHATLVFNRTEWEYDRRNMETKRIDPADEDDTKEYDAAGRSSSKSPGG